MADQYTCAECGGIFTAVDSDERAHKEAERNFGARGDSGHMAVVCDDCYKRIMGEVTDERAETRRALRDPQHPWHSGLMVLAETYAAADLDTRTFLRKIVPYAFDENGALMTPATERVQH